MGLLIDSDDDRFRFQTRLPGPEAAPRHWKAAAAAAAVTVAGAALRIRPGLAASGQRRRLRPNLSPQYPAGPA